MGGWVGGWVGYLLGEEGEIDFSFEVPKRCREELEPSHSIGLDLVGWMGGWVDGWVDGWFERAIRCIGGLVEEERAVGMRCWTLYVGRWVGEWALPVACPLVLFWRVYSQLVQKRPFLACAGPVGEWVGGWVGGWVEKDDKVGGWVGGWVGGRAYPSSVVLLRRQALEDIESVAAAVMGEKRQGSSKCAEEREDLVGR